MSLVRVVGCLELDACSRAGYAGERLDRLNWLSHHIPRVQHMAQW
jgi:hypothetical protein